MTISNEVLAERIEAIQAEIEPLLAAASEASWQLNVTSEEHWEQESTRLDTELRTVLSRPEPYAFWRQAAAADDIDPDPPIVERDPTIDQNSLAPLLERHAVHADLAEAAER